jgi:hypothetical protein
MDWIKSIPTHMVRRRDIYLSFFSNPFFLNSFV